MMANILFTVPLLGQTVKVLAHRCSTCGTFQKKFSKILKNIEKVFIISFESNYSQWKMQLLSYLNQGLHREGCSKL